MDTENRIKTGVILARFQPIHNGHLALIKKACLENDEVLIFIGSVDKLNYRNPIPWNIRRELVIASLDELKKETPEISSTNIKVIELPDLSDETENTHDWGFYLYANVVEHAASPYFTIYYSDGFEIITSWFPGWLLRKHISLSLLARNSCVNGISATAIREALVKDDTNTLQRYVPQAVFKKAEMLKSFISVFKNPYR